MTKSCEYCKGRAYTKKPLTVITKYGRKLKLVFEFCPNCGRKMKTESAQAMYKHYTPDGATYITTEPISAESEGTE